MLLLEKPNFNRMDSLTHRVLLQDMHYAEFAEDEVSHFVRLSTPWRSKYITDQYAECRITSRHQGIRIEQMESHWAKGRQASKGRSSPWTISTLANMMKTDLATGLRAIREGAFRSEELIRRC